MPLSPRQAKFLRVAFQGLKRATRTAGDVTGGVLSGRIGKDSPITKAVTGATGGFLGYQIAHRTDKRRRATQGGGR